MAAPIASLREEATGELHPIECTQLVVGSSPMADVQIIGHGVAAKHFVLTTTEGGVAITAGGPNAVVSVNGDQILAGPHRFVFVHPGGPKAAPNAQEQLATNRRRSATKPTNKRDPKPGTPADDRTVLGAVEGEPASVDAAFVLPAAGKLLIGRDASCDLRLDHVSVSRTHAFIDVGGGTVQIADRSSANGTFVNGLRITSKTVLKRGDRVDIGPYSLMFDGASLASRSDGRRAELACRSLIKRVVNRQTAEPLTLLDRVSLVVRPGEFVCLIGPSGSGKSTLLSILSGRRSATSGDVLLNGVPLHQNFDALKQSIAVVPQQDKHHDLLSVDASLSYTARLRLPPDTSTAEVAKVVDETLRTVQLSERKATLISNLSGGQLKRVSLATELVSQPSVLFLDEVTSGLDEQTDRDMMALFANLAKAGRTVVCVTHNLSNVVGSATHVAILTTGGKLAFFGEPAKALDHFDIDRLGDVYLRMAERPPEQWRHEFEQHEGNQRLVRRRMPRAGAEPPITPTATLSRQEQQRHILHQATALIQRRLSLMLADRAALIVLLLQSLLVALLIGLVFGNVTEVEPLPAAPQGAQAQPDKTTAVVADRATRVLFLLAISCLWFGCNNSAKEIVKERIILTRERLVNLRADAYLLSLAMVLCGVSVAQASLLLWLVDSLCSLPLSFVMAWISLAATTCAGVGLGLLVSSFAKSEDVAVTMVPVLLIPQIILSGFVNPLEGVANWIGSTAVTTYWSFESLKATLNTAYAEAAGSKDTSLLFCWLVIGLHTSLCFAVTYNRLRSRGAAEL